MSDRVIIGRWESDGGKYWVELYRDAYGYGYDGKGCGGFIGKVTEPEAVEFIASKTVGGAAHFHPGKRPMRRTVTTYTVEPKRFNVGTASEWVADVPTVTFRTAAGLLRWALNARVFRHGVGGVPYPTRFDDKYIGDRRDVGRDYHLLDTFRKYEITAAHLTAMRNAQRRYEEIVHYLREVEPQWTEGPVINYADNSIERTDTDKYGNTRRVMLKAPSGDACF